MFCKLFCDRAERGLFLYRVKGVFRFIVSSLNVNDTSVLSATPGRCRNPVKFLPPKSVGTTQCIEKQVRFVCFFSRLLLLLPAARIRSCAVTALAVVNAIARVCLQCCRLQGEAKEHYI